MILALETSQPEASVYLDGAFQTGSARATSIIMPMIESVMQSKGVGYGELKAIAVSRGPGAFTGVRLGCAVAQALALAHNIPLAPVCSLAALAHQAFQAYDLKTVVVAVDARMGEVYWAEFDHEFNVITEPSVGKPEDVKPQIATFGYGNGFALEGFSIKSHPEGLPSARDVAAIGARMVAEGFTVAPSRLSPAYVRDNVAHKKQD